MILTLLLGLLGGPLGWGVLGVGAQAPGSSFSDPHGARPLGPPGAEAVDGTRGPRGSNWCHYQTSRVVTFVTACKTERFLVHSQQPCSERAPNCLRDRVMYRVAHRPVYRLQQRVLPAPAWRCCPGFRGPNCEHHDPAVTPAPAELGAVPELWEQQAGSELELREPEAGLARDLQNDVHQAADGLPGPWTTSATGDLTVGSVEAIETELESPTGVLEQVPLLPVDTLLQEHVSPIWKGFNDSLHSLSRAVQNLTLDLEANRQALWRVQDSSVASLDLQELGAKFEAKVQEHGRRVDQLWHNLEGRLEAQQQALHQALAEVQTEMNTIVKRLLKAQEHPRTNGSQVGAAARPEPESLQARLGQLQRNLSELHAACRHREQELQEAFSDVRATLVQHTHEIKELYSESDETFDQISNVERLVEELQVNTRAACLRPHDAPRDDSSLWALRATVEATLSTVNTLGAEGEHARAERARLRSRVQSLDSEVRALRMAVEDAQRDARQLHGSFAALLQDGLRHEAALAALFGEEALEELSEGALGPLPLRYGQVLEALRDAARGLQDQALGWHALEARVEALERAPGPGEAGPGCEASCSARLKGSLQGLQGALSATQRDLEQQRRLFHALFGNFQGLLAANVSLDLGKLQATLGRKGRRQKEPAAHRTDAAPELEHGAPGSGLWVPGSPVAFYASLSHGTGTAAPQTVKFNAATLNAGSSYFPEHGYFRAPTRGVYLFAVSVEFGPGPGTGQLVIGGHHQTAVCTAGQRAGGTASTFAMAELQRGERVWFELTQGTVATGSPTGTAFGGFLMFST
nr:LOW QUALITY PROTEIN: multimerin-2 [Cavia porcellus]